MDSAQSLLSKYIEIIVRKPPSPDFLAPKAGESMKGINEIEGKIYMIFTESVTLMFNEGGCAAVTPHRRLRPPTMQWNSKNPPRIPGRRKSARPTRVSARWPVCPTLSLAANPLRSLFSWAGVVGGSNRITVSVCIAYIYLGTFHALPCFWGQEIGVWRGFRAIFYVRLDRRE